MPLPAVERDAAQARLLSDGPASMSDVPLGLKAQSEGAQQTDSREQRAQQREQQGPTTQQPNNPTPGPRPGGGRGARESTAEGQQQAAEGSSSRVWEVGSSRLLCYEVR